VLGTLKNLIIKSTINRKSFLWNFFKKEVYFYSKINRFFFIKQWVTNKQKFLFIINKYAYKTNDFFFIQIGACDGIMGDPLYNMIKSYNWSGILIEPQKNIFNKLKETYKEHKNLIFENVAISEKTGKRNLYKLKEINLKHSWEKGLASFYPTKTLAGYEKEDIEIEEINCLTFDDLIDKYNVNKIDFLQIDVEGYDYEIIKQIDFNKIKPVFLQYEHKHINKKDHRECIKFLKDQGYKIFHQENDSGAFLSE